MRQCFFDFQIVNKVPPLALQLVKSKADIAKAALVGIRIEHPLDGLRHSIENATVSVLDEDQFNVFPPWNTILFAR